MDAPYPSVVLRNRDSSAARSRLCCEEHVEVLRRWGVRGSAASGSAAFAAEPQHRSSKAMAAVVLHALDVDATKLPEAELQSVGHGANRGGRLCCK